ncbi:MAG: hypothetical protein ACR2MF_05460 [Chthoniobacterales bacterium]
MDSNDPPSYDELPKFHLSRKGEPEFLREFKLGAAIPELSEFDREFLARHKNSGKPAFESSSAELAARCGVTLAEARERLNNVIGIDWYTNVLS